MSWVKNVDRCLSHVIVLENASLELLETLSWNHQCLLKSLVQYERWSLTFNKRRLKESDRFKESSALWIADKFIQIEHSDWEATIFEDLARDKALDNKGIAGCSDV
jgi:hypothetical protein